MKLTIAILGPDLQKTFQVDQKKLDQVRKTVGTVKAVFEVIMSKFS